MMRKKQHYLLSLIRCYAFDGKPIPRGKPAVVDSYLVRKDMEQVIIAFDRGDDDVLVRGITDRFFPHGQIVATARLFLGELLPLLNRRKMHILDFAAPPKHIAHLVFLIDAGIITKAIARKVLGIMCHNATDMPQKIITDNGWLQLDKKAEIEPLVDTAMHENPKAVEDWRGGKHKAANVLRGAVMRMCNGRADPDVLNEVLEERLCKQP